MVAVTAKSAAIAAEL
jgi:hypothetical protein